MKPIATFNQIFVSILVVAIFFGATAGVFGSTAFAQKKEGVTSTSQGDKSCSDGRDNDKDGKADWKGAVIDGKQYPPDPSCINADQTETADDVADGSLVPCTNKCDLAKFFQLLNTMISFLIKVVLFPIAILLFVYAGYKYITAGGNPSKKANIKRLIGNLILGMVIILTAWLVVKTALLIVGYDQTLYFFQE